MDDYQRHLERQLQQQQQQLRSQTADLNGAARGLHHQQPPQQHQQQRMQPPPQWTSNVMPGTTPAPSVAPINPGFGRGVNANPMGIIPHQQPAAAQVQQPNVHHQMNAFQPSPSTLAQNLHNSAQTANVWSHSSPAPPGSPVSGDIQAEKLRIATILEINSHLIKVCMSLQSTVPAESVLVDPTYKECVKRLQENLAYLAAIADRANKGDTTLPTLRLLSTPPMIGVAEEKDALDKLYKSLASLQSSGDQTNGDNASGSESGSQVNSPQVRSRQDSAGSMGASAPLQQHIPTPPMQRSQLPGHAQQHTPSPHLLPSQLHGQSGLNPNATPTSVRPAQSQQPHFQPNFPQNQQFHPQNQNPQFQQLAQHPQFQQQAQNQPFPLQSLNPTQYAQQLQAQQLQTQTFQHQTQNPQPQTQQFQPSPQQTQTQQFQQTAQQSFQQQQQQQQQQQTPHLQPRVPSRPPSRPSSQHSLTAQSHQPSPTMSPRPTGQVNPSPQLSSTPAPQPNPTPRMPRPSDLSPEQQAVIQERMRLARLQFAQQQGGAQRNIFPGNSGVQGVVNGFGNGFPVSSSVMMNGMPSASPTAQNQNFGAGSDSV